MNKVMPNHMQFNFKKKENSKKVLPQYRRKRPLYPIGGRNLNLKKLSNMIKKKMFSPIQLTNNTNKLPLHIACCFAVKNCEKFLPMLFSNLNRLSEHFAQFSVVYSYDNCKDNTPLLLELYKQKSKFPVYVINNHNNNSTYRTVRISTARNNCLDIVYNTLKNVDFHIMIDGDDVNHFVWNIDVIKHYLHRNDWDGISFNRKIRTLERDGFYDIWALLYENINQHFLGFKTQKEPITQRVCDLIQKDIKNKINKVEPNKLFKCRSAFNGFAIYRTKVFKNIIYDGLYKNLEPLISDEEREKTLQILKQYFPNLMLNPDYVEVCEHQYYHLTAIQRNNARIRISPKCLHF
jgi:hypothetical protein